MLPMLVSFSKVGTKGQVIAKRRMINPFVPLEWRQEFTCGMEPFPLDRIISRKRLGEQVNGV
jgi:hypothetical protein